MGRPQRPPARRGGGGRPGLPKETTAREKHTRLVPRETNPTRPSPYKGVDRSGTILGSVPLVSFTRGDLFCFFSGVRGPRTARGPRPSPTTVPRTSPSRTDPVRRPDLQGADAKGTVGRRTPVLRQKKLASIPGPKREDTVSHSWEGGADPRGQGKSVQLARPSSSPPRLGEG